MPLRILCGLSLSSRATQGPRRLRLSHHWVAHARLFEWLERCRGHRAGVGHARGRAEREIHVRRLEFLRVEEPGDVRDEIIDLAIFAESSQYPYQRIFLQGRLSVERDTSLQPFLEPVLTSNNVMHYVPPPLDDLDARRHPAIYFPQCREDDRMKAGF